MKKMLVENILPFWLEHAIDYKYGGIYTQLDEKGEIFGTDKSVWFQGRSLWTFSKAYNLIEQNPEYLKAAENIYNFLPKCTDTDGRMFFAVTEDGRKLQKRTFYFSETFAAIGCAEYYKATKRPEVLAAAKQYFTVAYECFKGIRPTAPKSSSEDQQMKALSPAMIMLSTAQVMRSIGDDDKEFYNTVAAECLDEVLNGGYLTQRGMLESVSVDGAFVDSPDGRVVNPGHSLEAAWFVMLEGILTGNQQAIDAGKKIIDITLPLGWDEKYGGILMFVDINGRPPLQLEWDMKKWWPQCEAMIALRLAYQLFGDEKYREKYEQLKTYCDKYFVDPKYGEWYGYLHYDNTVSISLKGNIFKGPFHIPRLYMIMAVMDEDGAIDRYAQ